MGTFLQPTTHAAPRAVRVRRLVGLVVACLLAGAGGPARSNDVGSSAMLFGLFGKKYPSTVNPQVGGALKREAALPASLPSPATPSYPQARRLVVSDKPPAGTLASQPSTEQASVVAHVVAVPGQPPVAVVNTFGDDRGTAIWRLDPRNPSRFDRKSTAAFDPDQSRWVMSSATGVTALPAGRVLIQLGYHRPEARQGLYVYDPAADRVTSLGRIQPDWSQGAPFTYVSQLPVRPDALLVMHHTDEERLGPQRFVNHFDHLVLYSPRFPDGLAVATVGIDDGNVRQWGIAGATLWLRTVDERAKPAAEFVWSLDLGRVL